MQSADAFFCKKRFPLLVLPSILSLASCPWRLALGGSPVASCRLASRCPASCCLASRSWCLALGVSLVYQKCTNQRPVYQSTYSGTPLPKCPSEASRTNWRTLGDPCNIVLFKGKNRFLLASLSPLQTDFTCARQNMRA